MKIIKTETPYWVGQYKHELCGAIIELSASDVGNIVLTRSREMHASSGIWIKKCPYCKTTNEFYGVRLSSTKSRCG